MEADGATRVVDLHLWAIGPGIYSAIVGVVTPVDQQEALLGETGRSGPAVLDEHRDALGWARWSPHQKAA